MVHNERKERTVNLYLSLLLPFGVAAVGWALLRFPIGRISVPLIVLSLFTIFFSSYLRIQLPRTKIHLTVSEILVFLSFLLYGGEAAVLLAVLETAFTSLNFRRQGVTIKLKTVAINVLIAAVSGCVTALTVNAAFGTPETLISTFGENSFYWALILMTCSQFVMNSLLVSAFVAIKSESTIWKVWNENCLNALVMYVSGAAMAGICAWAVTRINIYLFMVVCGFFALVYLTYRRYVDDVKVTAAKAEESERSRADEAEKHVIELEHYVSELEKSSEALRESREKFRHAAYHDELTDLPNRAQFLEVLKTAIDKSRINPDCKFSVLFLDLNRFKNLNDSLGHSVGDKLLLGVAERLERLTPDGDLFARFSGDEYAILHHRTGEASEAIALAEEVASSVAEPFLIDGRQIFTTVSVGIAFSNPRYDKAEEILRDADIAMYYAKAQQKKCVIFDREMHSRAVTLLELETDLRFAIQRNEFELFYQPIVNLADVRLEGFEALVRWNHPQRGLVPPNEFISVAESTGLIIPMTVEILRSACRQLRDWQKHSKDQPSLMVSVNLSVQHLADPHLAEQITSILEETDFNPAYLKLEITESGVMENAENAILMLNRIRATGVKLSIDDFGTGYSSLSYLHRLPVDMLKIDRSFVSTMEEGTENGEIVRTVIALAKALKLGVVAEGIESIHQFHQLRILGCELGQGYLFSRPLPVAEMAKLLENKLRWQSILPMNPVAAADSDFSQLHWDQ